MPLVSSLSNNSGRGLGLFGATLAQITSITDNFNRSNSSSLGFTSDGKASWSVLSGSFSISSNKATSSNSSAIAVVDLGASNVTASAELSWGGDALYFRVVDSNNWWRVGTYFDQVTGSIPSPGYTLYYWYSNFEPWTGPGLYDCLPTSHGHPDFAKNSPNNSSPIPSSYCYDGNHSHTIFWTGCSVNPTALVGYGPNPSQYPHQHYISCGEFATTYPPTSTPYTENYYYVTLERCVNGSITVVNSTASTYAYTYTSFQVTASGSSITVRYNNSSSTLFTTSNSTHSTATKHGIGRRNPVDASSSSMDNFSVSRL